MGIVVRDLVKRFGNHTVIDHVNLDIANGELVCLVGPSGCGKTTILRCIAGLETPDGGKITINDRVVFDSAAGIMVEPWQRDIGMVFQSYAIWPHLTVFENVAFPLRIRRTARNAVAPLVERALAMVGLGHVGERPARLLSGGQQQRVALARAIVHSPTVLLCDEPLSNLDTKLREQTRAEIRRLQRELGATTVYVTHDQSEALSLADRIFVLSEGVVRQSGNPRELYAAPRDAFVADVLGTANLLPIKVTKAGVDAIGPGGEPVVMAGPAEVGAEWALVRPDRIELASEVNHLPTTNRLTGTVKQRLFLGGNFEYLLDLHGAEMRALSRHEFPEASQVAVGFAPSDCVVLPGEHRGLTKDSTA